MLGDRPPPSQPPRAVDRRSSALWPSSDVGNDAPVIDREPLAGPAESSHHFVADHQDAVLRAEIAKAWSSHRAEPEIRCAAAVSRKKRRWCGRLQARRSLRSSTAIAAPSPTRVRCRDRDRAHGSRRGRRAPCSSGADRRSAPWRRACPVVRPVPCQNLGRPVYARAIFIAFSLASAPPLVKKKTSISPGASSASFAPSFPLTSWPMNGFAYASAAA